jgi:AAA15 family ATPase/GTPase
MITEIHLENFKCHKKIDLEGLRPLTIITGPNNSGKSAILQSIAFLREWTFNRSIEALNDNNSLHSFEDMVHQKKSENLIRIGLGITSDSYTEEDINILSNSQVNHSINEIIEQIIWKFSLNKDFQLHFAPHEVIFNNKTAFFVIWDKNKQQLVTDRPIIEGKFQNPFGAFNTSDKNFVDLLSVISRGYRKQLQSLYYILPKRGLEEWNSPLSWESDGLWPNGGNIGTYITYLYNKRSELFDELESWLKKFDPSIQSLRTPLVKEDRDDLQIRRGGRTKDISSTLEIIEQDIPKHLLTFGSGLISILPVVVQLIVCEPGSTIFIEEPEIHLHHGAIEVLLDLFIEKIKEEKQIILTTHSIDLLNSIHEAIVKDPELKEQVIRYDINRDENSRQTKATRIQHTGDYKPWSTGFKSVLKPRPS